MLRTKVVTLASAVAAVTFLPVRALAITGTYGGNHCSFADFPNAAHNRIHHHFQNTSGSNQWTTCAVYRNNEADDLDFLQVDTSGTAEFVRFEQRDNDTGVVSGWNPDETFAIPIGTAFHWFAGPMIGNAADFSAFALEARLTNNAAISRYNISTTDAPVVNPATIYAGSHCSFADHPTAPHSRIHHSFVTQARFMNG